MKGGKLPNLALLCFLLIFFDPFASLQADETTNTINSSTCEYNCSTVSPPESYESSGLSIVLGNLAGIVCCIAVANNCFVLFTFKKDGLLRLPQNYFFMSLTVADLLTALVSMPIFTQYVLLERWVLSQTVCDIWMAVDWTLRLASLYLRALITMDKFFSAKYPTKYMLWRTPPKAKITICGAWFIPAVTIIAYIFGLKHESKVSDTETCEMPFMKNKETALYISVVYFWIPVVTIGSLYVSLYATSYSTYKQYGRLRKSWTLCNKKQLKTRKSCKRQKGSTKEGQPLTDLNAPEIVNLEQQDDVKPRTKDFGNGDIISSEYVYIKNYIIEPSVKVNRDIPPYCSPIIKVTSPVDSEPKSKNTILDEDLISSDEEFMRTLYRSTAKYPVDSVQDSPESTATFLIERKNRSKDKKAKPRKLKSFSDSSDSDDGDLHPSQNNTPTFEAVSCRPRTNPKKDFTKSHNSGKNIESTYNESTSHTQVDNVVPSLTRRNLNIKDNQTMVCNLLHIKSDSNSGDEVLNITGQGFKSPEPWGQRGRHHFVQGKLSLSVDGETNNTGPKGDQERKKVNENIASAQGTIDKTRCGRTSMENKFCLSQSPIRLSSAMNMVHKNSAYFDTSNRTADEVSSVYLEDTQFKADAIIINGTIQENRLVAGILQTLPEKYCNKLPKVDKTSKTIEEGDRTEQAPKLFPESQRPNVAIISEAIATDREKSKEAALMHQPNVQKKLCVLKADFNHIAKACENSGQITHAITVVPESQYKDIKNKSNQTCLPKPADERISLKTKTFFQQLQNTMRSSIEALSLSSTYFDSLHRALNVLPEDASFNQVPTSIDNINQKRCSIVTEPNLQRRTSTSRHPVGKFSENSSPGTRCETRDLKMKMGSMNGEEHVRSRTPVKSSYKDELCTYNTNFQTTTFCSEVVPGHQKQDVNLKVSTKSKRDKKDKKKTPPSILKSRDSHSRKKRCECGSKLNPPQAGGVRKLGQTVQINNIKTEPNCKAENNESRSRDNTDKKPVKSVYLDKISWASYLSQRSQTQDNKMSWDKSSSEEENLFSTGVSRRREETSREDNCMQSVTFEKIPALVNEKSIQLKDTKHEKVKEVKSSTMVEKPIILPDVTLVPVIQPEADRRRDLDRHPIFLYGVGNRCNGQIQLDTQSMKTAFKEITAISSLLCVFLICWLPLHVLIFADAFRPGSIGMLWYQVTTWLIYLNSMLNPFCYNLVHAGFLVMWQHLVRSCKT